MTPFHLALETWQASHDLRRRRRRYKRYTYGRQWDDTLRYGDLAGKTEYEAALINGQIPHTNNLIRQLVKCVIGNFRSSLADNDPAVAQAPLPDDIARRNVLTTLDCRMLEEFLISGCAIQRVVCEKRPEGSGLWIDNVCPDDFFVNRFTDPRGHDIELIGMLHSMSLREVIMRYGSLDRENVGRIRRAYGDSSDSGHFAFSSTDSDRFTHASPGRCRIVEVWTLEARNLIRCHDPHEQRLFLTPPDRSEKITSINSARTARNMEPIVATPYSTLRWHCSIYTSAGELLDSYDSPYSHGRHPFVVKFYPLIDGEIHSLVEDIIDQQRHINSLITLIDQIMRVSAKGVLLFPEDQLSENMTLDDVARCWAQPFGVLPYSPGLSNDRPTQIISGGENAGAYRMLETQLSLFQQVSGVNDALQGRLSQAQTSAALFDSQLRSSAIALLDLLDTFNEFRLQRNLKVLSTN